ncbi:helix-turn-helix transcriptional regulator [Actinocorallia lasiicapitis]
MPTLVRDPLDPYLSMWHWLAFQLRYLRELNGLSLTQVGQLIGCQRSTVSNQESGKRRIDMDQAAKLDLTYKTGNLLQLLLHHAQTSHNPEWFKQYSMYEARATIIRIYSQMIIPLPFQTAEYMGALLADEFDDVAAEIAVRQARQQALVERSEPPNLWLLLEEAALEYPYGGAEVMREQLRYLLDLDTRRGVSVRVLTKTAGVHAGLGGPFRVISTDGEAVSYAGAYGGGRLVQTPAEARKAMLDFESIGHLAQPTPESRRLIESKLEAYK